MHVGGEIDVRGAYCALSAAKLSNFSAKTEKELFEGTVKWIAECQTYEGGFGGAPGLEAHGGYSFCAAAALALFGTTGNVNLSSLLRWTVNRQMRYEGGFQGRTNKLVDGCYSFWQGALVPVVQCLIVKRNPMQRPHLTQSLFHREALQEYVLICCQRPNGGLIDKPGKPADLYHTCYTLSGLAISQHCETDKAPLIVGRPDNELLPTHPLHNIPPKSVMKAFLYFQEGPMLSDHEDDDEEMSEQIAKSPTNGFSELEIDETATLSTNGNTDD
jgi:protein farnesyltransferase subunit beta